MKNHGNGSLARWGIFAGVAAGLFALLWIGWTLVGRQHATPQGGSIHSDTTLSVGLRNAPASLDLFSDDTVSAQAAARVLIGNVVETLVELDQNNTPQPGLASEWKVSDDGLSYTFTMRRGVRFSNGHDLTASDVVYSLQRAINGKVADVDQLGSLSSVEAVDDSTVSITLTKPNPVLPRVLAGRLGVVFDEQSNADDEGTPVGSGPYTVGAFEAGKSMTLNGNDSYWGEASGPGTVTLHYYDDDAAMIAALRNSTIDMALPDDVSAADTVGSDSAFTVSTGMTTSSVVMVFNQSGDSITSDEQVRKAIRNTLDLNAIIASQPDAAQGLGGPLTPLEPGYEDLTGLYPHDIAQARSRLSYFSSHYLGTIDFVVPHQYEALAQTIVGQMQEAGLNVRVEALSDGEVSQRIADNSYDMTIIVTPGNNNASQFSQSASPYYYEDEEAQQAYAQAMEATNDNDFQDRIRSYAHIVAEDAASGWLYARKGTVVAKSSVTGYPTAMVDQHLRFDSIAVQ